MESVRTAALEIACGLRALGIGKGDVVALNSETRLEFYLADVGVMANGSVAAAMYPSYPAKDQVRTIRNCDAKAVFVETPKQLPALAEAGVARWILLTGEAPGAMTLDELRASGRAAIAADPELPARLAAEVHPADPAVLYLTSGATGEPKMVLVTHGALVANADMAPHVFAVGPQDRTIAFLPSAHIAQRVVIELLPLRCGMPVTFAESLLKLPQEIRKVRPTLLLAPPRMWERIYSTICTGIAQAARRHSQSLLRRARARPGGGALPAGRQAGPAAHPRPARDRRPHLLPQGSRPFRRPAARGRLRRGAAQQRPGRILRSHRHAAHRRLRPHRRRRGVLQSNRQASPG